ncbi:MAG: Asp23/Gls24 family envelope stress response protein [Clostridia bacterium]|nr:Asp23/Gls24 family envelope stress response protein [Clostridia bacterium]MDD4408515.1 Asp23/Gls24 family envelope stress response protein [Clostridia bacterium]
MKENNNCHYQGKLTCNKNILYSIINLATNEISGVAGMSKKSGCCLLKMFQNKNFNGIKIKYDTNGTVIVDVYIDVYNDISVPDICSKVQENIRNSILSMVDIKATKINVHIINVIISKDENENASENNCI